MEIGECQSMGSLLLRPCGFHFHHKHPLQLCKEYSRVGVMTLFTTRTSGPQSLRLSRRETEFTLKIQIFESCSCQQYQNLAWSHVPSSSVPAYWASTGRPSGGCPGHFPAPDVSSLSETASCPSDALAGVLPVLWLLTRSLALLRVLAGSCSVLVTKTWSANFFCSRASPFRCFPRLLWLRLSAWSSSLKGLLHRNRLFSTAPGRYNQGSYAGRHSSSSLYDIVSVFLNGHILWGFSLYILINTRR